MDNELFYQIFQAVVMLSDEEAQELFETVMDCRSYVEQANGRIVDDPKLIGEALALVRKDRASQPEDSSDGSLDDGTAPTPNDSMEFFTFGFSEPPPTAAESVDISEHGALSPDNVASVPSHGPPDDWTSKHWDP